MLLLAVLVVVLPPPAAAAPDPSPTFTYGDAIRCTLCPPGTRMKAPCTRSQPTECAPCPSGHYTQYRNFLPACLPCRAPCDANQRERHECAPTRDRDCECAPGHYWRADQCVRHTRCGPGFGAKRNGTTHTDTECERCPRGTFSVGNSAHAQCTPHSGCSDTLFKVLRGTTWHDNLCVSCAQLENEGCAVLLQDILPKFFIHEKLRVGQLKRIIRLLGKQTQQLRSTSSKEDLLRYIHEWTGSAQDEELWKLPEMLESMHLHRTANKLKKMFKEFQNASECSHNHLEKQG